MARFTVRRAEGRDTALLTLQDGAFGAGTLMRIAGLFMPRSDEVAASASGGSAPAGASDAERASASTSADRRGGGGGASASSVQPARSSAASSPARGRRRTLGPGSGGSGEREGVLRSAFAAVAGTGQPSPTSERSARSWRPEVGSGLGSDASGGHGGGGTASDGWESAQGSSAEVGPGPGRGLLSLPNEPSSGESPAAGSAAGSAPGSSAGSEPAADAGNPGLLQLFALDEDAAGVSTDSAAPSEREQSRSPHKLSSGASTPSSAGVRDPARRAHRRLLARVSSAEALADSPSGMGSPSAADAAPAFPEASEGMSELAQQAPTKLRDRLALELVRCRAVCPDWQGLEEAGAALVPGSGVGLGEAPEDALVLEVPYFLARMPPADPAPDPDQAPHLIQGSDLQQGVGIWLQAPAPDVPSAAPAASVAEAGPLMLCRRVTLQVARSDSPAEASGELQRSPSGPKLLAFASLPHVQLTMQQPQAGSDAAEADPTFSTGASPVAINGPHYSLEVDPVAAAAEPSQLQLLCAAALWAPGEMAHILGRAAPQRSAPADPDPSPALEPARTADGAVQAFSLDVRVAAVALSLRGSGSQGLIPGAAGAGATVPALAAHVGGLQGTLRCSEGVRGLVTEAAVSWGEMRLRLVGGPGDLAKTAQGSPQEGPGPSGGSEAAEAAQQVKPVKSVLSYADRAHTFRCMGYMCTLSPYMKHGLTQCMHRAQTSPSSLHAMKRAASAPATALAPLVRARSSGLFLPAVEDLERVQPAPLLLLAI